MDRRRRQMNLDVLRPWDVTADPKGRPALKPFDDVATLIHRAGAVFAQVDPQFRIYYRSMADADLLDLENRKGKAPGAYCQTLAFRKMPLIFMNAVGVDRDVSTLLHESGHAFHSLEASRLPLVFQRHPGSEMAEVASMSMELLAAPFLSEQIIAVRLRQIRREKKGLIISQGGIDVRAKGLGSEGGNPCDN